jgi:hypothetical protein
MQQSENWIKSAESSKQDYGSKRTDLAMMMMIIMIIG